MNALSPAKMNGDELTVIWLPASRQNVMNWVPKYVNVLMKLERLAKMIWIDINI